MTFVAVLSAVEGLIAIGLTARALRDRRSAPAAPPPPPDHPTAAKLVEHDDGAPFATQGQTTPPGRTTGIGPREPATMNADQLEEMRQDFLADVSHELKTPVGALALLAEAVLDAAENPHQVRRFGGKILQEANRLGSLVSELIALSRLHERVPELATVEVGTMVRESLGRCQLAVESANIQITVNTPSGLYLTADATSLVTALSNLIDNAVSYSPAGSHVSVGARLTNGFVEVAVTDQGRGIAPEHQQRVFERFFRVDPALSRSTGGTGLGLAIVKRVALNHGGDVQLRSAPGAGSTFTVRIPAPHSGHRSSRTPSTPEQVTALVASSLERASPTSHHTCQGC
ncbi:MAG: hypothetical protein JO287_11930 [Pseudonocardiales bacterium]|nr:hypothetical protein [Pseudonocardiales bacterium]